MRSTPLHTDATGAAPPDAFGPFRVLHQIGAGALGPVFRAYDPQQDRLVAVKLFQFDLPPERVQQLVDALRGLIAADLGHPGIAAPIAAGIAGASAYLAQDFVASDSLDTVMREFGPSPAADAARVAVQLAGALDFAAAADIRHGALHPRDVLLTTDDARLTGLGVTQILERLGVNTSIRRPYAAPERAAGRSWDRRADIFSLAALVIEMIVGRRIGGSGARAVDALPETEAADVTKLRAVFAKALAERPDDRYETATAFAEALKAVVEPPGAKAPVPPLPLVAPPVRPLEPRLPIEEPVQRAAETLLPGDAPLDRFPIENGAAAAWEMPLSPHAAADPAINRGAAGDPWGFGEPAAGDDWTLRTPSPPSDAAETLFATVPSNVPLKMDKLPETIPEKVPESIPEKVPERMRDAPAVRTDDVVEKLRPALAHAEAAAARSASGVPVAGAGQAPPPAVQPPGPTIGLAAASDASQSAVWPIALALTVGLIVGVALGFFVFADRTGSGVTDTTAAATATSAPASNASPAAATPAAPAGASGDSAGASVVAAGGGAPAAPNEPTTASATGTAAPAAVPPAAAANAARVPARAGDADAARRAAVESGRLLVRSSPAGARVELDGRDVGTTPVTLRALPYGTHALRVTRSGYAPDERRVVISATQPAQSVIVDLARPGSPGASPEQSEFSAPLIVESRPAGAAVFLNGRRIGTTPLTLESVPIGSHALRLELDGYRRWTSSVRVAAGQRNRVTASLEQ